MKILVAGIGNIFLGDDGFGPEVARHLLAHAMLPAGVEVVDYGIRGMDLAFALTSGLDAAILVDAVERGGEPGTLYILDPDRPTRAALPESHALDPATVLQLATSLGAPLPPVIRVVGCEPARFGGETDDDDLAVELSEPVQRAVPMAAGMVARVVQELRCTS